MSEGYPLRGKVALVTGAARGIGGQRRPVVLVDALLAQPFALVHDALVVSGTDQGLCFPSLFGPD